MTRGTSGLLVTLALISLVVRCGAAAPPTVARVGMLTAGSGLPALRAVFHRSLRDLGYVEGHNLTVEQRQAGGQLERLPALAAELVRMRKRTALDALGIATQAKANTAAQEGSPSAPPRETLTTAIHLPRATWTLLRAVAFKRAQIQGGRASVSSLLVELVEQHRAELEQEAGTSLL